MAGPYETCHIFVLARVSCTNKCEELGISLLKPDRKLENYVKPFPEVLGRFQGVQKWNVGLKNLIVKN